MTEQGNYQVRFDWGTAGARALGASADIVVWVDELPGDAPAPPSSEFASLLAATAATARRTAAAILQAQVERGGRIGVAVLAAGGLRADGSVRFAVEDMLAAGAVIDALAEVGIDHTSPEAAAAAASYTGLARAFDHLLSASVSAQQIAGEESSELP